MDAKQLLEAAQIIEAVKPLFITPNQWLPIIAAVAGAFVGGISAFLPNYLIESHKRRTEQTSVMSALQAEISALITIVETRRYVEQMKEAHRSLQLTPGATYRFRVRIPDHYSRVYQSHVVRIGVLKPELAAKIIQFHQLIDSIVQDITPGGIVADLGGSEEALAQLVDIADKAMALGRELINKGAAKQMR